MNILENYKLVLGSQSPRRKDLLAGSDITFEIRVIETDESYPPTLEHNKVAEHIAIAKAAAHDGKIKDDEIIITADTIVVSDDVIYGKPKSKDEAVSILLTLGGGWHVVYSGVCIKDTNNQQSFTVKSEVEFANITKEEAEYYVDKYSPMDKAGAYGIQDWIGIAKVKNIKGSYTNILGLPSAQTYDALKDFIKNK